MEYIKQITGNINKDYELLKTNHILNINFVGNIENIENKQNLLFIKNCYDSHIRCHKGYYKGNILKDICAIIEFPKTIDEYFQFIGCKSRNMIRKAQKTGFIVKKITNYNEFIDDIYEINTSKEIRQSNKMSSNYINKPNKQLDYISDNKYFNLIRYGCFKDNKLVAYCYPYICNNTILINQILGHGDYQKYGIMNLLIYKICEDMIVNFKNIKYWWYINWFSGNKSLQSFKKSMGFCPKLVNLENIYNTNFLSNDLTIWKKTNSVVLESNILKVIDSKETTPGISYIIPVLSNQKYIYSIIFESYNDAKILLFGYDFINKQQIFKKELLNDKHVVFTTPENCSNIEFNLLFRHPIMHNFIIIKDIELNILK
jgi:hypothetical protein